MAVFFCEPAWRKSRFRSDGLSTYLSRELTGLLLAGMDFWLPELPKKVLISFPTGFSDLGCFAGAILEQYCVVSTRRNVTSAACHMLTRLVTVSHFVPFRVGPGRDCRHQNAGNVRRLSSSPTSSKPLNADPCSLFFHSEFVFKRSSSTMPEPDSTTAGLCDSESVKLADFPSELVHEILQYASCMSTHFCLTLCRVSAWTRHLALPHLYSTIVITDRTKCAKLCVALSEPCQSRDTAPLIPKTWVRNVWLNVDSAAADHILTIFKVSARIRHLALTGYHFSVLVRKRFTDNPTNSFWRYINAKQDLHLTITAIYNNHWSLAKRVYIPSLTTPLFTKITRLRLVSLQSYQGCLNIAHFTRLTHFAIPYRHADHARELSDLDHIFALPSLEMFVIVLSRLEFSIVCTAPGVVNWVQEKRKTHSIVHLATTDYSSDDFRQEWEMEVKRRSQYLGQGHRVYDTSRCRVGFLATLY